MMAWIRRSRVPIVRQSEAAECGLACIAMISCSAGRHVSLSELRHRHPTSLKGATLAQLVDIARKLGFSGRAVRLDLDELERLQTPCILHWDMTHFVVLERVARGSVVIVDPARGRREVSHDETSRRFTGVALELTPVAGLRARPPAPTVSPWQLSGSMHGVRSAVAQVLSLSLALQVFILLAPFFMQWVVDQVLVSGDRDLLAVLGIGFSLSLLLQASIGLLRGWSLVHLSSSLGVQWVGNTFSHVLRLPIEFFERRHLGDITSRLGSVHAIRRVLTTSFVESIIDGVMALGTLTLMFLYDGRLAFVTILAVLLYLLLRAILYGSLKERSDEQLVAAAKQQTHLLESLRGIQAIRLAGHASRREATYSSLTVDTLNGEVALARMGLGFATASQLIFGFERIAVVWLGALAAMDGRFTVGMLIAYLAYKDQFVQRTSSLVDKWVEFRMLRLHGERLADILLCSPQEADCLVDEAPNPSHGAMRVEVQGLSFRYADGDPWVLRDCSFVIEPGECVAIAGASGCGKTTLLKVMLGLLKPTEGVVRLGGIDVHRHGGSRARDVIGAVMQGDPLFAGTILDNISLFDPDADPARVEAVARVAGVHDDIVAMPMGYHSLVGDMGAALSGGQLQRVVLARALYRQPRLLVLDEATSHLDMASERRVNVAVRQLEITRLLVAHRTETIASADRVLLMEGGRIASEWRPERVPAAVVEH